ncbi:MAG: type transport system ATP-binding protein [Solirubrobacteraceae bacterium]|nr:type transport system ATP-binding protein [Solirubrobacteraceae bacterium]
MSNPVLAIVEGPDAGREFPVTRTALIGRDPGADVVVADSEVSTKHASFVPSDGGVAVEDHASTNGTFVNGERVTGSRRLQAGDRVKVGNTVLEVRIPAPAPPAAPAPAAAPVSPAAVQATRIRRIPTVPVLAIVGGPKAGTEVAVGGQVVIGRDPGAADVTLEDDPDVSRRHAAFSLAGGGVTVEDLGSTNGTLVNGQRLSGTVPLKNGDKVQVGDTVIEIRIAGEAVVETVGAPAAPPPSAAGAPANDIIVENLVKEFGKHRAVDGISLHVDPGEIYGFLGPNGAGKSTTVHMLTTLLPPSSGIARVSGFDVTKDSASVRSSIGVALQAAALDPHLNAWEHMDLQTALQGLPKAKRKERGAELLERVGLTDAASRNVGGYSGGMKRRLDLALALVHWPRVLFLDEPTTGLDPQSRTALWEEVARLVKEEGMTVFLTTQYLEEADIMADRVGIIDSGEIVAEDTPAALKAEIGRPTVEVVPVDSAQWGGVSEVLARFGELVTGSKNGVAVRLRPGIDDLADVIRGLDAAGLRVANVQLHAPTLDDVFLAKTGRSLEGAAQDAEGGDEGVLEQINASGVRGVAGPVAAQ